MVKEKEANKTKGEMEEEEVRTKAVKPG